jgi:TfoX/Sxy family transcriptional regulator of competence genes
MAYDEKLAGRVRKVLARRRGIAEKKMFGGLSFLVNGHMSCGIVNDELMVRVGPDGCEAALSRAHVRPMDFTGRPMKGLVYVGGKGISTERQLRSWIDRGVPFARSQPAR